MFTRIRDIWYSASSIFGRAIRGKSKSARGYRKIQHRSKRRLHVEYLEDRTLMSADGFLPLDFGSLAVDTSSYHPDTVLLELAHGAKMDDVACVVGSAEFKPLTSNSRGLYEVRLSGDVSVDAAIKALSVNASVRFVEPNYRVQLEVAPDDPRFGSLWGLHNTGQTGGTADADIDAPEAWSLTTGSHSTIVAVIDTGVDYTHADLAANMWVNPGEIPGNGIDDDNNGFVDDIHGYDFVNNDADPMDDQGHGTHVAGTIGAAGNNNIGVVGVNHNVQIMALKFLSARGSGFTADAIRALDYAVANGARISNNSWGGGGFSQGLFDAIAHAGEQGHLFVAAAGNSASNNDASPAYPASYDLDNIISVAATDHNDQRASFSSYGATTVDLGAPGVGILSSTPGNNYRSLSGTSMATPHVAGTAALAWSTRPDASLETINNAIMMGVDPVSSMEGITVTGGRVNAFKTISIISQMAGPFVASTNPRSQVHAPMHFIEFRFNEAMDRNSFNAADDIIRFTGPAGNDLRAAITATMWNDERTLRIEFAPQSQPGDYTIEIGPQILSSEGNPMDQDFDGTAGESGEDRYSSTVAVREVFNYAARPMPFLQIDLEPDQPGVFTVLDGWDDGSANINLGSSTFNLYGTQYTGSTLFASSNGLLTFGTGNADYLNRELASSPGQAAIAPLWDDWRTDRDSADQILGLFQDTDGDGTPEWLVIEWNQVQHYSSAPSTVTFQAILQLNTQDIPGAIVFNYPDLDSGDGNAEGASATVGIKDAGTQGFDRLLVSFNDASTPLVGTGQAIQVSVDTPADGDLIAVTVGFADSLGNPIDRIELGQSFRIHVSAQDLRSDGDALGVLSTFADVLYDNALIDVVRIVHLFDDFSTGSINSALSEVDEVGGLNSNVPSSRDPQLVFYLEAVATGSGTLSVNTNVGESVVSENALFGIDNDLRHRTNYLGNTIQILSRLALDVEPGSISEDDGLSAATGTVRRRGDVSQPLTVFLTSSDLTELAVPASVTIEAGQATATFPIDAVDDDVLDGTQTVMITATADGYLNGSGTVDVTDHEIDLLATSFDAVTDHVLGGETTVVFTIKSIGVGIADGFRVDLVHSDDEIIGNDDDVVVGRVEISGGLPAGQSVTKTVDLRLDVPTLYSRALVDDPTGMGVGHVSTSFDYLGLVIDPTGQVNETNETNNFGQGKGVDADDITFFPWDVNRSSVVTPSDVGFIINRRLTNDRLADLDGDGVVSASDAASATNRIGYVRNNNVIEGSLANTLTQIAYDLDQRLQLGHTGNDYLNWGGWNEKWMRGSSGTWYFITPDGSFYQWNGGGLSTSRKLATLDASYYEDTRKLHNAPNPTSSNPNAGLTQIAYDLDQRLQLGHTGNDYLNWGGWNEKWMRGSSGTWYFITPDGSFYRWNGGILSKSTRLATLDASYYQDTRKLYGAS